MSFGTSPQMEREAVATERAGLNGPGRAGPMSKSEPCHKQSSDGAVGHKHRCTGREPHGSAPHPPAPAVQGVP